MLQSFRWNRLAWIYLLALVPLVTAVADDSSGESGSSKRATEARPLLLGDWPDPTILKDGDDYYMTHSSFGFSPGLLIWHSKDLKAWSPIGSALADPPGSVWAPELVKVDGEYRIYFPAARDNWVVTAKDIRGPWSAPVSLEVGGIDPGYVEDSDGQRYLHFNGGEAAKLSADAMRLASPPEEVYRGWPIPEDWAIECFCLESPKLTKRGEWFYLTSAQGGTSGPATSHMVVSARSRSATGPWENSPFNPIIRTHDRSEPWWSKGHGTLVEGPDGQWYCVFHGYKNGQRTLGRSTLIQPITWTDDGWFRVADEWPEGWPAQATADVDLSDDFRGERLGWQWRFRRHADTNRVTLSDGKAFLTGNGEDGSLADATKLTSRAMHEAYQIEVQLSLQGDGTAGLALSGGPGTFIGLALTPEGRVERVQQGFREYRRRRSPDVGVTHVGLRIVNDRQDVRFYTRSEDGPWTILQPSAEVSAATAGGWATLRPTLFATGEATAEFESFVYQPLDAPQPASTAAAEASRPNIVLIMADDMGWSDLGCYGGEVATPHLDDLARRGTRWLQFTNGGRCCPTRAQLLTGRYAHQAGIGFMEPTNGYNKFFRHIPEYQGFLNRQSVTLAEVLASAGYQTWMAGKWHVGAAPGQRPLDRGFDRFYGIHGGASSFFHPRPGQIVDQDRPLQTLPDDFYTTDAFAQQAAQWIRESEDDRPFFLYLAFTAPHWPLHAWPEDIQRYRGRYLDGWASLRESRFQRQKELGIFFADTELTPVHDTAQSWTWEDADGMDLRMAVYAAMIDRMDQNIGRVLQAIRDRDQEEDTLVLFLSDNGACAEAVGKNKPDALPAGHPRSFQGVLLPWANASNTPFRQFKHWTHEGGIATPLIACWPGQIPAATINRDQVGHVIDLMPTMVELSGATYPSRWQQRDIGPMEGISLVDVLKHPDQFKPRELYWEHEGNRAMRQGQWKAVAAYNDHLGDEHVALGRRTGRWELYDMSVDRTELDDLAEVYPEKLADMVAKHQRWEKRVGVRDWESLLRLGGLDTVGE